MTIAFGAICYISNAISFRHLIQRYEIFFSIARKLFLSQSDTNKCAKKSLIWGMSLGKKLKDRRIQLGFSREALAYQSKVGQKSIYNYERELRTPTVKELQKLATALNTTVSWLLDEKDAEAPEPILHGQADEDEIVNQITSLRHRPNIRKSGVLRIISKALANLTQGK